MANFWDEDSDENDSEAQGDGPAALRKAYDKLKKDAQKLAAEKAEIERERDSLQGKVRSHTIAELLQAKGVSPKVAKYVQRDVEDPTEESVAAWLTENADVFNIKQQAPSADTTDKSDGASEPLDEETDAPTVDQSELLALMAALQGGGSPGSVINAGAAGTLLRDVEANAKSLEDVTAILAKHGIESTSGY